jgi:hypothetical protein
MINDFLTIPRKEFHRKYKEKISLYLRITLQRLNLIKKTPSLNFMATKSRENASVNCVTNLKILY